jgi:hypothetical protein
MDTQNSKAIETTDSLRPNMPKQPAHHTNNILGKKLKRGPKDLEWKGVQESPRRMKITTASAGTFYAELTGENPVTSDAVWE